MQTCNGAAPPRPGRGSSPPNTPGGALPRPNPDLGGGGEAPPRPNPDLGGAQVSPSQVHKNPDFTMESRLIRKTVTEISKSKGDFVAGGTWVGVNNHGVTRDGARVDGQPLLIALDESEWLKMLSTLPVLGLKCSAIKLSSDSGDDNIVSELVGLEDDGRMLAVVYWGLELLDNEAGDGDGDPRARLLPFALSGTELRWPYVYVYACISEATVVTPDAAAEAAEAAEAIEVARIAAAQSLDDQSAEPSIFRGFKKGFLCSDDATPDAASSAPDAPDAPDALKEEVAGSIERVPEHEPLVYKSESIYEYPTGTVVGTIPAGKYTESDHLERSIQLMDLVETLRNNSNSVDKILEGLVV